jgi:mannose-6-phosphate isomerase-like protein (cupin superfamily)
VPEPLPIEQFRSSETALRFEGADHGSPVSFFVTDHPPESSVPLHRHPYAETFIVQEGRGAFSVDDETIEAGAGEVLVVPAGAAHGFVSTGEENLRMVSIHSRERVEQEWLQDS